MPENRKTLLRLVLIALVLGAGVTAVLAYLRQAAKPRQLVLSGTLEARTVNVGSLVGGRVVETYIDEGSTVRAGQVIVRLETETVDRQIAEQQSSISAARAQLDKGLAGPRDAEIEKARVIAANDERERRRQEALYHAGIVARQLLDDATTRAQSSGEDLRLLQEGTRKEDLAGLRAQLEQQQRRLATLLKQRAELNVVSSVTGVVQSFALRPGDLVAPNQTVAELLESDQLWVRVYVPETLLGLIRVGSPVRVRTDTYPAAWFPGRISTVSAQGEYTPRNVQTRAQRAEQVFAVKVLVNPDPRLHAGMATEVDLGVKGSAG